MYSSYLNKEEELMRVLLLYKVITKPGHVILGVLIRVYSRESK